MRLLINVIFDVKKLHGNVWIQLWNLRAVMPIDVLKYFHILATVYPLSSLKRYALCNQRDDIKSRLLNDSLLLPVSKWDIN